MKHETRETISQHYAELTDAAEHEIRALIGRGSPEARFMASGVWHYWYTMTFGFQQDGDTERLEAMLHPDTLDYVPSEN